MPLARFEKFKSVLAKRQVDMTILTDRVHKSQNISAIMRTADAVGIPEIHMVKPARGRLVYHHTAGGVSRTVGVSVYDEIERGCQALKDRGYLLVAAQWSERSVNYREVDYRQPFALVLGAEKYGLSEQASKMADVHVTVPMVGICESLNVSVASGIILQEALHQRTKAGRYDKPFEETEENIATLFRWLHPKMAAFCDAKGLPYPALDEDGDIIPPESPDYRTVR